MKYVIGVDLGTSATKTILVDQNGKIVAEASVKYPMYQPENGWAEQDPSDWSKAAISTIKSVVEKGQVNGKDVWNGLRRYMTTHGHTSKIRNIRNGSVI